MSRVMEKSDASRVEVSGHRTVSKFIDEKSGAEHFGVQTVEYEPGFSTTSVHYHERRESAYIITEGTGSMMLKGESRVLKKGMIVFLSTIDRHGVVEAGLDGLKMVEVWAPLGQDRIDVE
jgi:mannose-6-phosphate isomerase-like protein (cupin superfamily)